MIVELNDDGFEDQIKTGLVLVKAWGENCQPCVDYLPEFEAVAEANPDVKFATIKVVKDGSSKFRRTYMVAKKIGEQIGTPTTFLFKDGEMIRKHYGVIHRDLLTKFLTQDIAAEVAQAKDSAQQAKQGPKDITKVPTLELEARGFKLMMQMNAVQNELQAITQELSRRGVK